MADASGASTSRSFGTSTVPQEHDGSVIQITTPIEVEMFPVPEGNPALDGGEDRSHCLVFVRSLVRGAHRPTARVRLEPAGSAGRWDAGRPVPRSLRPGLLRGSRRLPHFNPELDVEPLPAAVVDLRRRIRGADAVLLSVPEYAGALPGVVQERLGLDDRRRRARVHRRKGGGLGQRFPSGSGGRPRVAGQGSPICQREPSSRLHVVRSPVTSAMVGKDGLIADPSVRRQLATALGVLESSTSSASPD